MKTGWCGHSALTGGLPGAELRVRAGGRPLVWARPAEGRMCMGCLGGEWEGRRKPSGLLAREKRVVWG